MSSSKCKICGSTEIWIECVHGDDWCKNCYPFHWYELIASPENPAVISETLMGILRTALSAPRPS